MKKTLLAAALAAGFVGSAHAAEGTSVTLYGLIDAGVGFEQVKGPNGFKENNFGARNGVSSGSRWGMRGVEDLGGGLKAVFNLESGFNSQNGNQSQDGRLFGRRATIGLASDDWGVIEFGRQTNMASKYMDFISPFGTSYNIANGGTVFSAANTMRLDNMVMYQTPNFGGFSAGVGYSFNADTHQEDNFATNDNNRVITAGLRYTNGPLDLALSYDRLNPNHSENQTSVQSYILGGTYDFEVVKVHGAFGQTFDGWFVGTGIGTDNNGEIATLDNNFKTADGFRVTSGLVGFSAPVGGATKVFGSWGIADPNNSRLTGDNEVMTVYALGATYDLSKRTNLYAYASYANNYAFQEDVKDTAVAVGIRHRF